MSSRKTITILTSPVVTTKPLAPNMPSPTATKQAPLYRIEERSRTIYVASDVDPSQWDTHSLNAIFTLAEASGETCEDQVGRTHSYTDTQVYTSPNSASDSSGASRTSSPSFKPSPSRRSGVRSAGARLTMVPQPRQRILFYHKHDPYYGFTNFSPHSVMYKGKRYPTSEHLFQSFKFQEHRPGLAEHIRTCSERPSVAFSEARRFQPEVRADWKQVNIEKMDETLFYKFTQHPDLQAELLNTSDAELVEDSDKDAFWGVGADRRGRNELGKCLERLRDKLRGMAG